MRKRVCINLSAILFAISPVVAQAFIFYIAPLFYGIYNYVTCRNVRDMVKMYAISLTGQLIGLSLAEFLMYVVSSDYNDFAETPALLLINLVLTLFVDSIFLIVKFIKIRYARHGLIGKVILVGITYYTKDNEYVEQKQFYGKITNVFDNTIVLIQNNGEEFSIPNDKRTIKKAQPGEYTLYSTGEVVVNPDYLSTWSATI